MELATVDARTRDFASQLNTPASAPVAVVARPAVTTADALRALCARAERREECIGVILRIESFAGDRDITSGLDALEKPFCIVHEAPNRTVPLAHGPRRPAVFVGNLHDPALTTAVSEWSRAALGALHFRTGGVASFDFETIEGRRGEISESEIDGLLESYETLYEIEPDLCPGGKLRELLREDARTELSLRRMFEERGYSAFTSPGVAPDVRRTAPLGGLVVQRLMSAGYGFAPSGEPDTSRLVAALKLMGGGPGGTTFLDSPTYSRSGYESFGAHALEICPSIGLPTVRPGLRAPRFGDRVGAPRLEFDVPAGPAVNVGVTTLPGGLLLLANPVRLEGGAAGPHRTGDSPKTLGETHPAGWSGGTGLAPLPDPQTAARCWASAGGPRFTALSTNVPLRVVELMAGMIGAEFAAIDHSTTVRGFRRTLHWRD